EIAQPQYVSAPEVGPRLVRQATWVEPPRLPTGPGQTRRESHQMLEPATESCRVCASLVSPVTPPTRRPPLARDLQAVCAACEQEIRNRPQPIPGYQIVRELGHGGMG